jgi:hypothetical protein
MKTLQIIVATCMMMVSMAGNLQAMPTVMEILQKMDEVENLGADLTVKFTLTETRVNQGLSVQEGVYYRRDWDDAFLIVMTAPETAKGNGYLRVDESMWLYRRNTRTFQVMARGQKIEGSDADASDLETRKYVELYEPALDADGKEIVVAETIGGAQIPVYRIEVTAKVTDVDYPKKTFWVRQDNFLRLKEQAFALSGALAQTVYLPKYMSVEGRYVWAKQLIIDEFEKGDKTLVELSGFSLKNIDDAVFTKAYLENLSK